jgi:hypothetical protein
MGVNHRAGARQWNIACLSRPRRYVRSRSLLGHERRRFGRIEHIPLANPVLGAPLHQIEMNMAFVIGIRAVAQHRRKTCARTVPQFLAQGLVDAGIVQFDHSTVRKLQRAHIECVGAAMLADLRTGDAIARTAVERIEIFDPPQQGAGSSDRWCHVIGDPLCHGLGHRAAQGCRRREGDAMPVRQEHGIDLDDIGCHALPRTRDGRRWLEGDQLGQPQLARRAGGFRCGGLLAWDNRRSFARQWNSLGYPDRSGCEQSNCDIKGACRHVPARAATVRRALYQAWVIEHLQAHFAISSPSAANSGTDHIRNSTVSAQGPAFNLRHL